MNQRSAITKINKNGILLVFPINNKKEPRSLWQEFFPRKKMLWEWDDESDNRVADLWHLMKKLSDCGKVVYSKWYQGRATFFSRELFTALLCLSQNTETGLSRNAQTLFDELELNSPLSTKELKSLTDLRGKFNEGIYSRGMKELFVKFLVVAYGEVDDGAFPSLAVGATKLLFEDLWIAARNMSVVEAQKVVDQFMPVGSLFRKYFEKLNVN